MSTESIDWPSLRAAAREVMTRAYVPYSRFPVGAAALTDAVRDLGLEALSWPESLQQWRERVRCLREWMPDLGLPDPSPPDESRYRRQAIFPAPALKAGCVKPALGNAEPAQ